MKRYKLKRDLPTFKAGDEFIRCGNGNLVEIKSNGVAGVCVYCASTIEKFPNILTDWFEEINESTRWKPDVDQWYYCLGSDGSVRNDEWVGVSIDCDRFKIGNCFQTEEEAERVAEYLKALAVVRGDATTKFTKDESNYYVYYNFESNSLCSGCSWSCIKNGVFGLPYFAKMEDAERSIEQHKNEWLAIFGVKEENEDRKTNRL